MPALSPTMKEGKILKWLKKEGDQVEAGDAIAEIETDKATMTFDVQEKGFIAKTNKNEDFIPLGAPVVVITKKAEDVAQFKDFSFTATPNAQPAATTAPTTPPSPSSPPSPPKTEAPKPAQTGKSYPQHTFLQ
jgi:pyruvate/2-oxoglutarate dehydrogenase complex dihydrolipoamide acyltransferase (E2) component